MAADVMQGIDAMNRSWAKLTASTMALGMAAIGCTPDANMHPATLSSSGPQATKLAARAAARASSALARHRPADAVAFAETAVEAAPRDVAYRALLGQSYLQAGRFASAEAALSDAMTLDPVNAKAGLNLALAEAALGRPDAARATLKTVEGSIAPADLGLAMALCGDRAGAIRLLLASSHDRTAGVRARQNLAFALALGGEWAQARSVAAQDVAPKELDQRMREWAALAQPTHSWDQIAAVLGVTPAADPGEPQMLALASVAPPVAPMAAAVVPQAVAEAAPAPLPAPTTAVAAVLSPAPAEIAQAAPVDIPDTAFVAPAAATPAPASYVSSAPPRQGKPAVHAVSLLDQHVHDVADRMPKAGGGRFVVQLGAFAHAAAPQAAWGRVTKRFTSLASFSPSSMTYTAGGATLTRLSIAGFASRTEAVDVCMKIKAGNGACFVRESAGDELADWGKPGKGLALASR